MIDHPNPRPVIEAAIYGAAGIAQHAGLTRLLLERGADPNDEETPYHVAETHDNTVLRILLESGKLNARSLSTLLLRKCDWYDPEGVRLVLEHGADPSLPNRDGRSTIVIAARRGRAAALDLFEQRGTAIMLTGAGALIAAARAIIKKGSARSLRPSLN